MKTIQQIKMFVALAFFATALPSFTAQDSVSPAEARAIAKEAYIYGFPLVDSYRIQYSQGIRAGVERAGVDYSSYSEAHQRDVIPVNWMFIQMKSTAGYQG